MSQELLNACEKGDLIIVKNLLKNSISININYQSDNGWNALMYACTYGRLDIVKYYSIFTDLK